MENLKASTTLTSSISLYFENNGTHLLIPLEGYRFLALGKTKGTCSNIIEIITKDSIHLYFIYHFIRELNILASRLSLE